MARPAFSIYSKHLGGLFAFASSSLAASSLSLSLITNDTTPRKNDTSEDMVEEDSHVYRAVADLFKWTGIGSGKEPTDSANENIYISQLKLQDHYDAPKYPVVLCHGLSGFDKFMLLPSFGYIMGLAKKHESARREFVAADRDGVALEYWFGIKEALEERGSTVMVARVPGFGSIEQRAQILNSFISREVDMLKHKPVNEVYKDSNQTHKSLTQTDEKMKVNIIAHSMGGLDARYLISELEKKNYEVISLTTVTTPHRGSEVADYVVSLAQQLPSQIKAPRCIYQLTTEHMREFNEIVKDRPNVKYYSYGASFQPSWYSIFYYSWNIINSRAGENDGMVSVKSAKWGTYMGTLQNVDHLDLINWTNGFKRVVNAVVPESNTFQINSIALYLSIADELAKKGY